MRATINIQEDEELRAAVKDMIRGQVNAIIKEGIASSVGEQFNKIKESNFSTRIDKSLTDIINTMVQRELKSSYFASDQKDVIQKLAREEVARLAEKYFAIISQDMEKQIIAQAVAKFSSDTVLQGIIKKLIKK